MLAEGSLQGLIYSMSVMTCVCGQPVSHVQICAHAHTRMLCCCHRVALLLVVHFLVVHPAIMCMSTTLDAHPLMPIRTLDRIRPRAAQYDFTHACGLQDEQLQLTDDDGALYGPEYLVQHLPTWMTKYVCCHVV